MVAKAATNVAGVTLGIAVVVAGTIDSMVHSVARDGCSRHHRRHGVPSLSSHSRISPNRIEEPHGWHGVVRASLLPLVVLVEGTAVGVQGLSAENFAVKRTAGTGSWLGRKYQGRGIGKEMRAAIIHLAFAGLGAQVLYTSSFADNEASLGVTKSLGYAPNGSRWVDREGEAVLQLHFQLARDVWEQRRRNDIQIVGLDSCRELFGVPPT